MHQFAKDSIACQQISINIIPTWCPEIALCSIVRLEATAAAKQGCQFPFEEFHMFILTIHPATQHVCVGRSASLSPSSVLSAILKCSHAYPDFTRFPHFFVFHPSSPDTNVLSVMGHSICSAGLFFNTLVYKIVTTHTEATWGLWSFYLEVGHRRGRLWN